MLALKIISTVFLGFVILTSILSTFCRMARKDDSTKKLCIALVGLIVQGLYVLPIVTIWLI